MCGHLSVFSPHEPVDMDLLRRGLNTLHHRGPDASSTWRSPEGHMALGHVRLSIIDLAGGTQPMSTHDGLAHAVVNGEFYGYEDIRQQLMHDGCVLRSQSDSEIVLHLYRKHGTDCLQHLRGEFAFTLWDAANRTVFAARDRFGIKPLYYAQVGGRLYVASEVKALFAAGVPAYWDEEQLYHAHASMLLSPDRTLFRGVHQVPPGHFLLATRDSLRVIPYWDFDYPEEANDEVPDETACIEEVRDAVHEAIKLRLRADVPVASYLSGGLDSCAILGIAQRYASKPIEAYTIAFTDDPNAVYNEEAVAREMAAHCGAVYRPIEVTEAMLATRFNDAIYHAETFLVNFHAVAKFMLSESVRSHGVKVVLTGEGSDEIFAGYAHFRKDHLLHTRGSDAKDALSQLAAANSASAGLLLAQNDVAMSTVQRALGYTPAFFEAFNLQGRMAAPLLADSRRAHFAEADPYRTLLNGIDVARRLRGRNPVDQSMYLWSKTQFNGYILTALGDRMEMAHSVEGRVPLLDHKLVEKVVQMPANYKIKGVTEKHLLREAARPVLTETVYRRQKHPFLAPPAKQSQDGPLTTLLNDELRSSHVTSLYDSEALTSMLDNLRTAEGAQRQLYESVALMALSTATLQRRFQLS